MQNRMLTIGLDLGDRSSFYCVPDESGEIVVERQVRTTSQTLMDVFAAMPRSRLALETGTHSPWVSRLLRELEHEVIVANPARVRLIMESRQKDDRLDARTLARLVACPANSVPVELRQTGMEGARSGQSQEVQFRADCEFASTD